MLRKYQEMMAKSSVARGIASAKDYLVSKVSYAGSEIEDYLIGELRTVLKMPLIYLNEILPHREINFGLAGKVRYLTLDSAATTKALLDELDKLPKGRLPYKPISLFTGGKVFFGEETNAATLHGKRQLNFYLKNPEVFAQVASPVIDRVMMDESKVVYPDERDKIKKFSEKVVRRIMAKVVFDMDDLPANADDALSNMSAQFARNSALSMLAPQYVIPYVPGFRKAKNEFRAFAKEFLEMQLDKVVEEIQSGPMSRHNHLLAKVIQELMQKDGVTPEMMRTISKEDVARYFNEPDVMSLPWVFFATDNLSSVISEAIRLLDLPEILILENERISLEKAINQRNKINSYKDEENDHQFEEFHVGHIQIGNSHHPSGSEISSYADLSVDDLQKNLEIVKNKIQSYQSYVSEIFDSNHCLDVASLAKNTYLHVLYKASLRNGPGESKLFRYAATPIQVGDIKINANTSLIIHLKSGISRYTPKQIASEVEKLARDPDNEIKPINNVGFFSAGKRKCPGFVVADYIFKGVLAEIIHRADCKAREIVDKNINEKSAPSRGKRFV